ncbi:MAG: hypothetical protein K6T85_14125 [Gorillibacterium sp.]|nr:hypothetical protein [Gorillibacterium sp.]
MSTEKCIYVLLTDTGTLLTRIIKLVTRAPLNHASISFDENLSEVYSFGRKNPGNPFIGGFVKEDMGGKLFFSASCALYCYRASDQTYDQMQDYIQQIEKEKQIYKYNILGLFGLLLNIKYERKHAYFCSQFVAAVFEENGFIIAGKPAAMVRPGDFTGVPEFSLIYEGPLNQYVQPPITPISSIPFVRTA